MIDNNLTVIKVRVCKGCSANARAEAFDKERPSVVFAGAALHRPSNKQSNKRKAICNAMKDSGSFTSPRSSS